MRKRASDAIVSGALRVCEPLNLAYLNNAKAGCSTIKESLWRAMDKKNGTATYSAKPHLKVGAPFVRDIFDWPDRKIEGLAFFTVVRNPFVRILASYLEKIGRGKDPKTWGKFAARFKIPPKTTQDMFPFRRFLETIKDEPDELLDPHFAPQYVNTLAILGTPSHIGFLEEFARTQEYLAKYGVETVRHDKPPSGSTELLPRYFGDAEIELVRNRYADDFEIFGYSADIADAAKPGTFKGTGTPIAQAFSYRRAHGIYPPSAVDPQQEVLQTVQRAAAQDKKKEAIRILKRSWRAEDSWENLKAYAEIALANNRFDTVANIARKANALRDGARTRKTSKKIKKSRKSKKSAKKPR